MQFNRVNLFIRENLKAGVNASLCSSYSYINDSLCASRSLYAAAAAGQQDQQAGRQVGGQELQQAGRWAGRQVGRWAGRQAGKKPKKLDGMSQKATPPSKKKSVSIMRDVT